MGSGPTRPSRLPQGCRGPFSFSNADPTSQGLHHGARLQKMAGAPCTAGGNNQSHMSQPLCFHTLLGFLGPQCCAECLLCDSAPFLVPSGHPKISPLSWRPLPYIHPFSLAKALPIQKRSKQAGRGRSGEKGLSAGRGTRAAVVLATVFCSSSLGRSAQASAPLKGQDRWESTPLHLPFCEQRLR